MTLDRSQGFTLIEMLIVTAILAILCSSSMMLVTTPMAEAARATQQQVRLSGETALHRSLIEDAHGALRAAALPQSSGSIPSGTSGMVFKSALETAPADIRYQIVNRELIRLAADGSRRSFDLGSSVDSMNVRLDKPTTGMVTIELIRSANVPASKIAPTALPAPTAIAYSVALAATIFPQTDAPEQEAKP